MTPLDATKYFVEEQSWKTAGDDTQYLIKKTSNGNVIVIFDQSNSFQDWKRNFSFWKVPYKDMKTKFFVHAGYCKCWKACRDEIMDKIESLSPKSITITGHSYGGAIAILCAEDCWFRFIKTREESEDEETQATSLRGKIQCWTFGCPRILGLWNYRKIKERWEGTTLFNNSSDIVCCLPPFLLLYRHVTKQTHIGHLRRIIDFFRPDKWHDVKGDDGYRQHLTEIYQGRTE